MDAGLAIEYLFGRTDAASIAQYFGRNRIKEKPSKTSSIFLDALSLYITPIGDCMLGAVSEPTCKT